MQDDGRGRPAARPTMGLDRPRAGMGHRPERAQAWASEGVGQAWRRHKRRLRSPRNARISRAGATEPGWRRDKCDFLRSRVKALSISSCPRCWRPVRWSSTMGPGRARPGRIRSFAPCNTNRSAPGMAAIARPSPMPAWLKGKDTASCVTALAATAVAEAASRRSARAKTPGLRQAPRASAQLPERMRGPRGGLPHRRRRTVLRSNAVSVSTDGYRHGNTRGVA